LLSVALGLLVAGLVCAQITGDGGNTPQLPVGQTFKQFEWPLYQDGQLKATLDATEAKGMTLNRAETTELTIKVYDNGAVTTTVTSPKADLYVNEQKMRTKSTVQIERSDMTATSQDCDFDLKNKKYLLRDHVKVVLKHFDVSMTPTNAASATPPLVPDTVRSPSAPAVMPAPSMPGDQAQLNSPGAFSDTNSAPISPSNSDAK
jgi:hypothetical protein